MRLTSLQEALALVPEYWPLNPAIDKPIDGDEWFSTNLQWMEFAEGDLNSTGHLPWRRPIPKIVREAEARWILYDALASVSPRDCGWLFGLKPAFDSEDQCVVAEHVYFCTEVNTGIKKFSTKESARAALKLFDTMRGNDALLIEMLDSERPGALWRWVEAMRE